MVSIHSQKVSVLSRKVHALLQHFSTLIIKFQRKKKNTNNACRNELWKNGTKKINDSTNAHMYMYPSGYLTEPALLISTDGPPGKKPSTDPAQHKLIYQSP